MSAVAAAPARPSGGPSLVTQARWAVSDSLMIAKRYLLRWVRVPAFSSFSAIQPVMFVLLFRYVFGGAIAVSNGGYVNYLLPGIIVQTAAFTCFGTAIGLADDLKNGLVERFRSLPMTRSAVLSAGSAPTPSDGLFSVLMIVAVGYAVGTGSPPALPPCCWWSSPSRSAWRSAPLRPTSG